MVLVHSSSYFYYYNIVRKDVFAKCLFVHLMEDFPKIQNLRLDFFTVPRHGPYSPKDLFYWLLLLEYLTCNSIIVLELFKTKIDYLTFAQNYSFIGNLGDEYKIFEFFRRCYFLWFRGLYTTYAATVVEKEQIVYLQYKLPLVRYKKKSSHLFSVVWEDLTFLSFVPINITLIAKELPCTFYFSNSDFFFNWTLLSAFRFSQRLQHEIFKS